MRAIIPKLTCAQEKAITRSVRENVAEEMSKIQLQLDALWLNSVRKELHLGPKRLKRLYEAYFRDRKEYIEFYESDGYDGMSEYASIIELRNADCDIVSWYNEFGSVRVNYRISKGETQQLRESKERIKTSETLR